MPPARSLSLLVLTLASCASQADNERGPRLNTVEIAGGLQLISGFDSDLRLDLLPLDRGTDIDFEDDLGFQGETQMARVDARWRIDRRNAISVSWFDIERTAGRSTDRDIVWGPITIPAGSGVSAFFDTEVFKLNYGYTFALGDTWELGATIGAHTMGFGIGLGLNTLQVSQDFEATLPLPVIGVNGAWQFADDWRLTGGSQALYVELSGVGAVDTLEGYLVDTLLTVEWDLFDNFGLGLGGNWFVMDVTAEDDLLRLSADYGYLGALVYGRVYF